MCEIGPAVTEPTRTAHRWATRFGLPCVAVGALVLGLWQAKATAPEKRAAAERAAERDAILRGQEAYTSVQMLPIAEVRGPDDLSRVLAHATIESPEDVSRKDVEAILRHTAELLYYRFAQDDVGAYKRWRFDRGYRLADAESMRRQAVPQGYKTLTGKEYPGDEHHEAVFDELWRLGLVNAEAAHRVVGLAADPTGLAVTFGRLTTHDPTGWPAVRGRLAEDVWHGRRAGGHRNWWISPSGGAREHLRKHGVTEVACVGVIAGYQRGDRYPMRLLFFKDEENGGWWLQAFQHLNFEYERFPILEY